MTKTKAHRRIEDVTNSMTFIHSRHLKLERDLILTKWFAYRFMSPVAATLLFAREYEAACKWSFRVNRDRDVKTQPINWAKLRGPSQLFSQLWLARQRADQFCMPYHSYLEYCFEFAGRRTRKQEPRPNQLEGGENSHDLWLAGMAQFLLDRSWTDLVKTDVPQLHRDHTCHPMLRDDYVAFVFLAAEHAPRSHRDVMRTFVYERAELRIEDFKMASNPDLIEASQSEFDADVTAGLIRTSSAAELVPEDFWPSCFGLPNEPDCKLCGACPVFKKCSAVTERILSNVEKGKIITADTEKRRKDRERQARHRMKKAKGSALLVA